MLQNTGIRNAGPTENSMTTVCFRVTRACNLRCPYCQAPPNYRQLSEAELRAALVFFYRRGARRIKFTGGEPFIYHGLLRLIAECRALGMEPTVITNGTLLPTGALDALRAAKARVKISLHGFQSSHDALQRGELFDMTLANLRTFVTAGIETSVHTLVHKGTTLDLPQWVEFLIGEGVHKVSFMPFVPRGRGRELKNEYQLSEEDLRNLTTQINELAVRYKGAIIVRVLDFIGKRYLVFETDGTFVWEIGPEESDLTILSTKGVFPVVQIETNSAPPPFNGPI